jgi:hypothetical protein
MANAAGRPVEPIVLAANERAYLERRKKRDFVFSPQTLLAIHT